MQFVMYSTLKVKAFSINLFTTLEIVFTKGCYRMCTICCGYFSFCFCFCILKKIHNWLKTVLPKFQLKCAPNSLPTILQFRNNRQKAKLKFDRHRQMLKFNYTWFTSLSRYRFERSRQRSDFVLRSRRRAGFIFFFFY